MMGKLVSLMNAHAYKKQHFEKFVDFTENESLGVGFCRVQDMGKWFSEFSENNINEKEKIIVVYDQGDGHIVAMLSIVDSRDGGYFIHSSKFDIEELQRKYPGRVFLDIGEIQYFDAEQSRSARVLIWQAIRQYCMAERIDYLISCIPFPGCYPAAHAVALSYLHHFCRAGPARSVTVRKGVSMDIMPQEAVKEGKALRALPAQLRYCLRRGAKIGEGVFVDRAANRSEVFVLMPVA